MNKLISEKQIFQTEVCVFVFGKFALHRGAETVMGANC